MKRLIFCLVLLCFLFGLISTGQAKVIRTGKYEIYISGLIRPNDLVELKIILNENRRLKKWNIGLSSPGGHAGIGIAIFNVLREASSRGIKITTIIEGEAASMAAIIFLAGDKRIIYEGAQVMFHKAYQANNYGIKIIPAKGSDNEKALKIVNDVLINIIKKYFDNDVKKVDKLLNDVARYTAKEMFDLGMATKYLNFIN